MYGIRCFLCSRVALRHLSVGSHLAARCLSQCLGRQELASLKHHAACFQSLLGYSLCLPTLPFRPRRGITFCNEQARRIVILNTAPPDFAGEPLFGSSATLLLSPLIVTMFAFVMSSARRDGWSHPLPHGAPRPMI